jgi:flagellin-like protein
MNTVVLGSPGAHARSLAFKALGRAALLSALIVALVVAGFALGALSVFASDRGVSEVVGALLLLAAVVVGFSVSNSWASMRKAEIGWRSEKRVASVLDRCGAAAVVHGALLGAGGDVDHMVLGPVAVAVETKTGGGRVRIEHGRVVAGRRTVPGDPVAQARRQAVALGRALGVRTSAVVCLPDMSNRPFKSGDVAVCSLNDLAAVIAAQPHQLSPDQAVVQARRLVDGARLREPKTPRRR